MNSSSEHFDYIITGAGCAGLSLAVHLITSGAATNKTILLLDKDPKTANDRTWCFWEKQAGLFQSIVHKEWPKLFFHTDRISKELEIAPYTYKLIRGLDFYQYCFAMIKQYPNIVYRQENVDAVISNKNETYALVNGEKIHARYIFNSILFQRPELNSRQYWLLQHFKGWIIETEQPMFKPEAATLMDFRTGQDKGAAFFYLLPFSNTQALVEYTIFSEKLLSHFEYEEAIKNYLKHQLQIHAYTVCEEESGSIPMTNYVFPAHINNIINIGTAGGQTKGSSGYTFRFIQKHSAAIAQSLQEFGHPFAYSTTRSRFHFYDSILLHILYHQQLEGKRVFELLFNKNKASSVLKFLDNETSLKEELSIISSLPTMPFLKAAVKQAGVI